MATDDPTPQERGHAYLFSRDGWTDGAYASDHIGQGDYHITDPSGAQHFIEFKDLRPDSDLSTLEYRAERTIEKMSRQSAAGMDISHELSLNAYRTEIPDVDVQEFGASLAADLASRGDSPVDRIYLWSGEDRLDPKMVTFDIESEQPEVELANRFTISFDDDIEASDPTVDVGRASLSFNDGLQEGSTLEVAAVDVEQDHFGIDMDSSLDMDNR